MMQWGSLWHFITQSCFDSGCGWQPQPPMQHHPFCGDLEPFLLCLGVDRFLWERRKNIYSTEVICTFPDRDASAACYSNQLGMRRVGFSDSRKKCGSELNAKGENILRESKQLQLYFCSRVGCSITVVRRLCSELWEEVMSILRTHHQP